MDKVSSICKGSAEGENDSMKIPKVLLLQSNGEARTNKVNILRRIVFMASITTNLWDGTAVFKSFEYPKS